MSSDLTEGTERGEITQSVFDAWNLRALYTNFGPDGKMRAEISEATGVIEKIAILLEKVSGEGRAREAARARNQLRMALNKFSDTLMMWASIAARHAVYAATPEAIKPPEFYLESEWDGTGEPVAFDPEEGNKAATSEEGVLHTGGCNVVDLDDIDLYEDVPDVDE